MFLAASAALFAKAAYSLPARPKPAAPAAWAPREDPAPESALHHVPFVPWNMYWEGIDVFDVEDRAENIKRFGAWGQPAEFFAARLKQMPGGPRVGVQVIGLQDTGTNLLSQLLYRNFGGQVAHYDSSAEGELHGIWKHASMRWLDTNAPEAFDNLIKHNVVPLVMVRNPLSWLRSIKKAPYELESCVEGDDWLERPCVHSVPGGYVELASGAPIQPVMFEHLTSVWGRWSEGYKPYLAKEHFPQVIVVRYEDLVLHTESVMGDIARQLKLDLPEEIDIIDAPAKNHGEAVGHDVAVQRILSMEYMAEYSDADIRRVCEQLKSFNATLVEYAYHDCMNL